MFDSLSLRRLAASAGVFLVAASGLFVATQSTAHAAATQPLNIVSIGDSYASGEGDPGPNSWIDSYCHLSDRAAPHQAAEMLYNDRPLSFSSYACSGSVIEDTPGDTIDPPHDPRKQLLGPGGQLSQIGTRPIDALTISIGGNDIHFPDILAGCMIALNDCSTDAVGTYPLQMGEMYLPSKLGDLETAVDNLSNVRNVFLTEYPDPTVGVGGIRCGDLLAPGFGGLTGITEGEATWASQEVLGPLNTALAKAVNDGNSMVTKTPHAVWHLIPAADAFIGHGYCAGFGSPSPIQAGGTRYLNTVVDSVAVQGDGNGTMHPNEAGQEALADVILNSLAFLIGPAQPHVTSSPAAVVNSPTTLTIRALTTASSPIVGAGILIDGTPVGTTDQTGTLTLANYVFTSAGNHTVTAQADPYPDGTTTVAVQGVTTIR